ncbi:MAG: YfhO family protein [Chlamydiota bacterium]
MATFLVGNFKLVTGEHSLVWDAEGFFAPAYTLVADHARAGRILLWNPWNSAGAPDYAEPELGATSPLMIITGAITGGTETGFRFYFLLIWMLGPIGLILLARHLDVPPWAAVVVAVGWAFNGFYTGHASHVSSIYSLSALPWILWRFDVALQTGRLWAAVESGALWGLSALGGYPQLTILTPGFLFLWAAGWWLCSSQQDTGIAIASATTQRSTKNLRRVATVLALCAVVGAAILAPSYVAFFSEGHGYSDRVGPRSRLEATSSMPMERGALATFSSPYLNTVNIYYTRLWPSTDGSYTNVYLGALIPIFVLLAFLCHPFSAWRWWVAGMAMFVLTCAVGSQLPVRGWLYDYIPPTRYFRNPGLFRCYGMLCVAVLALIGLKDLAGELEQPASAIWQKLAAAASALTVTACTTYFAILFHVANRGSGFSRATWYLAITWGTALAIAVVGAIKPSSRRMLPAFLVVLALADGLLSFSIGRAATVSANYHARQVWDELNAAHNSSLDLTANGLRRQLQFDRFPDSYPNNHNVVVKGPTFRNYDTMTNRFQAALANDPALVGMALGNERIWFSRDGVEVPPSNQSYDQFAQRSQRLGAPVVVVHSPSEMIDISGRDPAAASDTAKIPAISRLRPAQRVHVNLIRYTPNHLDFKVNCPGDGWLLVTDRWARGWRARVNGRSAEVFGGDFIFRALRVSSGQNTVQFSYRPAGFPWLVLLSWGTLAAVCANSIRLGRQQRAAFARRTTGQL